MSPTAVTTDDLAYVCRHPRLRRLCRDADGRTVIAVASVIGRCIVFVGTLEAAANGAARALRDGIIDDVAYVLHSAARPVPPREELS